MNINDAIVYSLPVIMDITQSNSTDFSLLVGLSDEVISEFIASQFANESPSETTGSKLCTQYVAAMSLLSGITNKP